jgi:hypothetical protein
MTIPQTASSPARRRRRSHARKVKRNLGRDVASRRCHGRKEREAAAAAGPHVRTRARARADSDVARTAMCPDAGWIFPFFI